MNLTDEKLIEKVFEDYVVLEGGSKIITEYAKSLYKDNVKEKYRKLLLIKEIAKNKLNSTIIDEKAMTDMIIESDMVFSNTNKKREREKPKEKRNFYDLNLDEDEPANPMHIKFEYLSNNSIVYVDSFKEYPLFTPPVDPTDKKLNIDLIEHSMFSSAQDKSKIFLNHYNIIKYFLLANQTFKTKFQHNIDALELMTLDCFQGSNEEMCVLGILMLNEKEKYKFKTIKK